MVIALIHNAESAHLTKVLSLLGEIKVFADRDALHDYLIADTPCDLVVSATDGAAGMNCCTTAHSRRDGVPILWITEQETFEPQSWRIPVDAFLVKPVEPSTVFATAERLLQKGARDAPDMVETFVFCCHQSEKSDYFKQIWNSCTACRKRPAIYHAGSAEEFWRQMETQPVEGALILLPDAQGRALYARIRERCPHVRTVCFYTPESEAPVEKHMLPYPMTPERMKQALARLAITPCAEDDLVRRVVTRPGCLTPDNIGSPHQSQSPQLELLIENLAPPPKKRFSDFFTHFFNEKHRQTI